MAPAPTRGRELRPKLTYANVVATLALFVAVGGASALAASQLGKNSVGTKQLRNDSVTGAKIMEGTITGSNINLATLAKVPSAQQADTAASASDADQLGGFRPSHFHDRCPAGTTPAAADLCVSPSLGTNEWSRALILCYEHGFQLPSPTEAWLLLKKLEPEEPVFWTDAYWVGEGEDEETLIFSAVPGSAGLLPQQTLGINKHLTYCVTPPVNN